MPLNHNNHTVSIATVLENLKVVQETAKHHTDSTVIRDAATVAARAENVIQRLCLDLKAARVKLKDVEEALDLDYDY